jgi:gamma-glutamylcyclotransferase (GGCT)/AIG2-like uncharacterized protein YtfP
MYNRQMCRGAAEQVRWEFLWRSVRIGPVVTPLVFFYGTLMAGFDRRRRAGIDDKLTFVGRGSIEAALFDLGIYPAAVPAPDARVLGEIYEISDVETVLSALDDIEGFTPSDPDRSLYLRRETTVTFSDGRKATAWAYFYNAPLGQAERIPSGDYLAHVKAR